MSSDVIYVLKEGHCAESGNHEELLGLKGIYFNMVAMQREPTEEERPGAEVEAAGDGGAVLGQGGTVMSQQQTIEMQVQAASLGGVKRSEQQ